MNGRSSNTKSIKTVPGDIWDIIKNLPKEQGKAFDQWISLGATLGFVERRKGNDEVLVPNSEKFRAELNKYRFDSLSSVKDLSIYGRENLIKLLETKSVPYKVAMLSYLGFFDLLMTEYFSAKDAMHKELESMLGRNARTVRGLINSLASKNERYTSYTHMEEVRQMYGQLKKGSTPR